MRRDPLHDEIDKSPDELDGETLERVADERRKLPDEPPVKPRYHESPGMGEDENGEQPSRQPPAR